VGEAAEPELTGKERVRAEDQALIEEILSVGLDRTLKDFGFKRLKNWGYRIRRPDIEMAVVFHYHGTVENCFSEQTTVYYPALQKFADELVGFGFNTRRQSSRFRTQCMTSIVFEWYLELLRDWQLRRQKSFWVRWNELQPHPSKICHYLDRRHQWKLIYANFRPWWRRIFFNEPLLTHDPPDVEALGRFIDGKWRQYCRPWLERAIEMGPAFVLWERDHSHQFGDPNEIETDYWPAGNLHYALCYKLMGREGDFTRNVRLANRPERDPDIEARV